MKYFLIYLAVINVIALIVMGIDKTRAQKERFRVPEKILFILSAIGGSIGSLLGMYLFHHKTKKWYFVIGMPLILIAHIAICAGIIYLKMK